MDIEVLRGRYLNSLKRFLTRYEFEPEETWILPTFWSTEWTWKLRIWAMLHHSKLQFLRWISLLGLQRVQYIEEKRRDGQDWPVTAETMVGLTRLNQLHAALDYVVQKSIPGDLLEAGVWRGGAGIFMAAYLEVYGLQDRTVYLADSFEGLPPPSWSYQADATSRLHKFAYLAVGKEEVVRNFRKYDVSLDRVEFLEGFFGDSLPSADVKNLALLRMDGDMYESTFDILVNLYHKVSEGGIVIVDDWKIPQAQKAVRDFLGEAGKDVDFQAIDDTAVFFYKPKS
jgi:O-methyltransferase